MFKWIVKDDKDNILFTSESYCEAYNFLFGIDEDDRKRSGIFLDFVIEDWG